MYSYGFVGAELVESTVICSFKIKWNNTQFKRLSSAQSVYKMENELRVEEVMNYTVFLDFTC